MAIGAGQHTSKGQAPASSLTTTGITTTSGSTLVVGISLDSGTFSSIQDSKSNSWTQIGTPQTDHGHEHRLYYAKNITGGSGHTVTINMSPNGYCTVCVMEITVADTSAPLDQNNVNLDTASPFTSPVVNTTVANELLVSFLTNDASTAGEAFTQGNSFTNIETVTDGLQFWCAALAYRIVSATGAYNSSTTTNSLTDSLVSIATFKEGTGGGDVTTGLSGSASTGGSGTASPGISIGL